MPPLPRRAMGPDRNCRQLDCPVPIAHRGRGSAEVDLKATFSYNQHVLANTTKIENGIIPPPPRRAMGPDRNCRQLNCPVPIAHRGGAALLRLPWRLPLHITAMGRPYSDPALLTTKHERALALSTLSYKKTSG